MSVSINGVRRSSRIAQNSSAQYIQPNPYLVQNICNCCTDDYLCKPNDNHLQSSVNTIKLYLDECENSRGTENKCALAKKLFEYLIANPALMIQKPRFRYTVSQKVNELKGQLISYQNEFDLDTEAKALVDIVKNISNKVRHSKMQEVLNNNLTEMKSTLYDYNTYIKNESLMTTIKAMEKTLEDIKSHPEYVVY